MRSFAHPVIRRSILALAITQLVICSVAPLHELGAIQDGGTVRIERLRTSGGTPAHDPDTCAICRFSATPFTAPAANSMATVAAAPLAPAPDISIVAPARSAQTAHQTRAPPRLLA